MADGWFIRAQKELAKRSKALKGVRLAQRELAPYRTLKLDGSKEAWGFMGKAIEALTPKSKSRKPREGK